MMHPDASPLAGSTIQVLSGPQAGQDFRVEDWWDRIAGRSWMVCDGNPACLLYAMSSCGDPIDDEVLYGKIGSLGHLVHVTRLDAAPQQGTG